MRAFIIRPFGTKNEINFDEVERVLIAPALREAGAEGGTTIDIVESGNIRTDMFRRLLKADLVVADLSIHNANVFYELGIRHALRAHGTFMLRCDADRFPFDLQTDRYFVYSKADPAASLAALTEALRRTLDAQEKNAAVKDSPVFTSLPDLAEPDQTLFNPVPQDFGEEVARAVADRRTGDLALLSYEVEGFEWEARGWRAVGAAQFDLDAHVGAKVTWERVRELEPDDLEANIRLGTVYERLGDLTRSTAALERALGNRAIRGSERAEAYSLLARNFKTRWRAEWKGRPAEERAAAALRSPHLQESFENYERAFDEDLNHFYSGLNALAMLKIMIALAESLPEVWAENFDTDKKADDALEERREQAARLVAAVELSLNANAQRVEREQRRDVWAEISAADLRFLTTASPARVAAAYRRALADAPGLAAFSVRKQLAIYRDLELFGATLPEIFKVVGEPPPSAAPGAKAPPPRKRVLLFSGHMIDAPGRERPRFPADKEQVAREKIREVVVGEMESGAGVASGYAGGASGGDILFHEVCAELGIETRLCLGIPPQDYVVHSVFKAGPKWVERFWRLHEERSERGQTRVLSTATDVDDSREYLPAWLREKQDYGIWSRTNLWMLFNAVDEGCDPKGEDPNITLIALWDGRPGDGPGGTDDLVRRVERLGARTRILRTDEIFAP
ncbi:MAG: tetratricopeptide repeat-containing protein [Pyrinomonadaceae bacterium]